MLIMPPVRLRKFSRSASLTIKLTEPISYHLAFVVGHVCQVTDGHGFADHCLLMNDFGLRPNLFCRIVNHPLGRRGKSGLGRTARMACSATLRNDVLHVSETDLTACRCRGRMGRDGRGDHRYKHHRSRGWDVRCFTFAVARDEVPHGSRRRPALSQSISPSCIHDCTSWHSGY